MTSPAFSSFAAPTYPLPFEDALAHLRDSAILEFRKGQIVYSADRPSESIYLVTAGKVKLSWMAEGGREVVLEILGPQELFGESAFLRVPRRSEQATALEAARLRVWPLSAIEDLVTKQPLFALALLQILAQRAVDLARSIESFSFDNIERRLARALIRFSERLGTPDTDGSLRMMPLTHDLLSRHVGTSRELVTLYMNRFRTQGYLRYSRRGIALYRDALAAHIAGTSRSAAVGSPEGKATA